MLSRDPRGHKYPGRRYHNHSDYAHIIPDSEIIKILDGPISEMSMFLIADSNANIRGAIGDYCIDQRPRRPTQNVRFGNDIVIIESGRSGGYSTFQYTDVFSFSHFGPADEFIFVRIKMASPQWDSILEFTGPRREEIWHKMYPEIEPPREFINLCNAFLRIFFAQLKTCKTVCPWTMSS